MDWVELPTLRADEDVSYWTNLSDEKLRNEIAADAFNLAAGLAEEQRRRDAKAAQTGRLAKAFGGWFA